MSTDSLYTTSQWLIFLIFVVSLLLAGEVGFRLGRSRQARAGEDARSQITTVQGAILALLGLLLAFTFSMAVSRYEMRKKLVVEAANAISTTYLRAQLLPQPYAHEVSRLLKDYVDVRLEFYDAGIDPIRLAEANARTESLHQQLWLQAIAAAKEDPHAITTGLFIQSLNEVIDAPTKRLAALENRVPETVFLLLWIGAILAVALIGFGYGLDGRRNMFLIVFLSLLIALVVLVTLDLDRPRRGLITVSQQSMLDLQKSLSQPAPWDEP